MHEKKQQIHGTRQRFRLDMILPPIFFKQPKDDAVTSKHAKQNQSEGSQAHSPKPWEMTRLDTILSQGPVGF